jgi:hypothetical protein
MKFWPTALDRTLSSFSETFHGPYPHLVFFFAMVRDAFYAIRAPKHLAV